MYIFAYSKEWAELITAQLEVRKASSPGNQLGYACICVGQKFDKVIENNYLEINRVTGDKLHIFSMTPPPVDFIYDTLVKVQRLKGSIPNEKILIDKLEELRRYRDYPNKETIIREKVYLLKDLTEAGLSADKYADFIFFEIREVADYNHIDVIAVKRTHLDNKNCDEDYIDLFRKMGEKAKKHFSIGSSLQEFINDIETEWIVKLSFKKALDIITFIRDFIIPFTKG